jgi:hypothetical protein
MTDEALNKLTTEEQINMLREIDQNYYANKLPEITPKYDKEGKIINEKEVKEQLKEIFVVIGILWASNLAIQTLYSTKVISNTLNFYDSVKMARTTLTVKEIKQISKQTMSTGKWTTIIDNIINKRSDQVKIKQVIKGNVNILNKQLQKTVANMYKMGKTKPQIARYLSETMKYNKGKAKSIAVTEVNFYKSEAQLEATKDLKVSKTWIHNKSNNPRETHVQANGQKVIGQDTYFNIGGNKTLAPQHFGIPSEDISCRCTMRIEVID